MNAGLTDLLWITILVIFFYFPISAVQAFLLIRNRFRTPRPMGNIRHRLLVMITTNGKATKLVEKTIKIIQGYKLPSCEIAVVHESYDRFPYSAIRIEVPLDYQTPNGSRNKMRAQHYGAEWLAPHGYEHGTMVVHLDDDSIPTKEYLTYAQWMTSDGGQGDIALRAHGRHLMSTLADMGRVATCGVWCDWFNGRGKPMDVHGEGFVVRADIESEIGWDFGTFGAEDLMFGQSMVARGYDFQRIPADIMVAPPLSTRDFYRQRRRWIASVMWSLKKINSIDPKRHTTRWLLYRCGMGFVGFLGVAVLILDLVWNVKMPWEVAALAWFNVVSYFGYYQYGVWKTNGRRYWLDMILLQIPVSLYENGTLLYFFARPPDRTKFETIAKV